MRTACFILSLLCLSACAEALPVAGAKVQDAKKAFDEADRLYTAVCVPALDDRLKGVCRELARALDAGDVSLALVEQAYAAVNELAE